ncbi:hypothetical protein C8R45DRAFT_1045759 [Mycena sanguinolenta]|nr:hypothetical protein C8R45DRAFT_1045759 [Mycena sanguinolenta]
MSIFSAPFLGAFCLEERVDVISSSCPSIELRLHSKRCKNKLFPAYQERGTLRIKRMCIGSVPSSRLHSTHASSAAASTLLVYTRLQRTTARYDFRATTPWTSPRRLLSILSATLHRQAASSILRPPRHDTCAVWIHRSSAAAAALRRGGGLRRQSTWERGSGSKAERRRVGGQGLRGEGSMSSWRSRSSQKTALWGAQHWSREDLTRATAHSQRLGVGPCRGWAVWTYTTIPFAVLASRR